MPAANQYSDPTGYGQQDPRMQSVGSSVNTGYGMTNLDPMKMGATDALARSPRALSQSQYGQMQQHPQLGARTQTQDQFYGDAPGTQGFNAMGDTLLQRTQGKRSSADIEAEGLYAKQQRDQASAGMLANLQARGIVPTSAMGLDYQNQVDRQVAGMLVQRNSDQQNQARTQYMDWLSQAETRRKNKEAELLAQQQEQERQREFNVQKQYEQQHWLLNSLGLLANKGAQAYQTGKFGG